MNYYDELDPETGQTYRIPLLEFLGSGSAEDFATRNKDVLIRSLANAIEILVNQRLQRVPIFTIREADLVFYLDRKELDQSMNQCIEYFTEIEEYEECIKLNNLKKKKDEKFK